MKKKYFILYILFFVFFVGFGEEPIYADISSQGNGEEEVPEDESL